MICQVCGSALTSSQIKNNAKFCSRTCSNKSRSTKITTKCKKCDKEIEKTPSQCKKNNFCSKACAASFNNKQKIEGKTTSKFERWIKPRLQAQLPDLEIHFNKKDTIGSELDIYIPSLQFAMEICGVFHYYPIHGEGYLKSVQKNDREKAEKCKELGIDLHILDVSKLGYFTTKRGYSYLKQILDLINKKRKN